MENQANHSPQDATSYSQDSANSQSGRQGQDAGKGGMLDNLTSTLGNIQVPDAVKNIQLPQAVKDFGATCSRSYNSMSTTQKVLGGAALLGASYWVASNQGWIGQTKSGSGFKSNKKAKATTGSAQHNS
ncbi:hypothetical protein FOE74_12955 [Rufibacter glacialis]|nr:hypothetical protein FOE74_12955 [Rufibacter glacialis]